MTERATKTLLSFGIVGTVLAALCCAGILTPLLIGLLAALGLGALTGNLDAVPLPALAVFAAISGVAFWRALSTKLAAVVRKERADAPTSAWSRG